MTKAKEMYSAQQICSCCKNADIQLMADCRTALVKCKIMKLADLNYVQGTCPFREVKVYPQELLDVVKLMKAKGYNGITIKEAREWSCHADDCLCISCVRVRFFLDNLEHIGKTPPKMGG